MEVTVEELLLLIGEQYVVIKRLEAALREQEQALAETNGSALEKENQPA